MSSGISRAFDDICDIIADAERDNDIVEDIVDFHCKFGLEWEGGPRLLPEEMQEFRTMFMHEELAEYCDAVATDDMEGMFDALIDLVYVAIGTAYLHGFDFHEGWDRVHAANMKKRRALSSEQSKRDTSLDVVKPHGWQPPRLDDLVRSKA